MRKENAVVGADVWLADVYRVVGHHAKDQRIAEGIIGNIKKEIRAIVAQKVLLLEEGRIQPLDKPTYQAAVKHLITMLIGETEDARDVKTARQTITGGARWNFGALNPSAKRRAQVSKAKRTKASNTKAAKASAAEGSAVAKLIADAVSRAKARGVIITAIADAIDALPGRVAK